MVGSPPENCTDIWRFGLMVMALSSSVLISSQLNSWTKPTWLASMKQGSHIMLQRLVRSTVSTEPRPCVMVLEPCLCSLFVIVGADVAAGEDLFQVLEERRVDGHHVFEVAVNGAVLHHQDLAVALDDLGFDLAGLSIVQHVEGSLAIEDLLADFRYATGAERIGVARPAQWGLGLFPRLQQGLVRPRRHEAGVLADLIKFIEHDPSCAGGDCKGFLGVFNRLVHLVVTPSVLERMQGAHYPVPTQTCAWDKYREWFAGGTTKCH